MGWIVVVVVLLLLFASCAAAPLLTGRRRGSNVLSGVGTISAAVPDSAISMLKGQIGFSIRWLALTH